MGDAAGRQGAEKVGGGSHFLTGPAGRPGRSLGGSGRRRRLESAVMRIARIPHEELPTLTRSVAFCLATILELDTDDVPQPPADHPEPWTAWRVWLATRGLGLVPINNPRAFDWPGPWLALLSGNRAAVAYGSPAGGLAWAPLGGSFADVESGYVVAPHDTGLWEPAAVAFARTAGRVEAIAVAPAAEAPMQRVEHADAHAGHGLEGDRYAAGHGTFSNPYSNGHDLTLIEAEVVDALGLEPETARRNVVTRGIDLNALVGRRFRLGEAECEGQRLCEPCVHLQRLTDPGLLRALVHRGGLRADIVGGGAIHVGDEIAAL
jgi:MOSC domain-containing protein YiiM